MTENYQTISLKELLEAGRITIKGDSEDTKKRIRDELESLDGQRYMISPVDTSLTIFAGTPRAIYRSSPLTKLVINNPFAIRLNPEAPDPLSFYMGGSEYRLITGEGLRAFSRAIFEFSEVQRVR